MSSDSTAYHLISFNKMHYTQRLLKMSSSNFTMRIKVCTSGLNDLCVMTFKGFIFVDALQSALLCNTSQLTNHRESRGHIGTGAWVGVSPQAEWLHVGWISLFSTVYSFAKAHIFFRRVTPLQIFLKHKNHGNTLGLNRIWEIQLDSSHMLKEHDWSKSTAAKHRDGLWLLESCKEEYTLIFHCSAVKALLTLHLHMFCIYCKNIVQGALQETEEYNKLNVKRL